MKKLLFLESKSKVFNLDVFHFRNMTLQPVSNGSHHLPQMSKTVMITTRFVCLHFCLCLLKEGGKI